MSELVIAEKSDLVGIADEVRQLTGQTKSLSLQEMQTGLKSIDNQPDWNQNDPTASDYIKNRPFYTGEVVQTEVIPEQTYTHCHRLEDSLFTQMNLVHTHILLRVEKTILLFIMERHTN